MADYDASQAGSNAADQGPIARPDVDSLPAGSMGPASGNAISGSGTITGLAGADTPGAGGASVVEVHGAGGASSGSGNLQASGQYGVLSMDAQGNYNYVRNPGTPDGVRDVFQYTLADAQGANASSTLTIDIGQILTANAGLVNLPAGVEMSDIHVVGRDLVIDMPDGTHMVIPNGAVFVPQLSIGDVAVPASNVAALLIDSEPQPAAGNTPSSGGNFAVDVPPLDPGVPLGDLIPPTELGYQPPEFRPEGGFVDREPTVVIVTPDNPAGAVAAHDQVSEAGLPARTIDGSAEPEGSNSAADIEGTSGTIVFVAQDGLDSVTVNGVEITSASVGQTIQGQFGVLTITSVNLANGQIGYTYAISDNTNPGGDGHHDDFSVVVTDSDGDVATATLTVDIIDDTPTANNDTDSVDVQTGTAAGNVVTAVGTTNNGADTVGADNAHVTGLSSNNVSGHSDTDAAGGFVVDGQFGTLTMNADGSYTYVLHEGAPGGSTDVFTYTLTDGDGDADTATLTINNPDRPVQITNLTPEANGGDVIVDEDDLQDGSDTSKESTTVAGNFNISAPDGVASLTVGGVNVVVDGVFQVGAHITTPLGNTLTFTGYNAATGEITYTYTLVDNENHPNAGGENSLFENFTVVLTDTDGDTDTDTLSVNIVDDVPTARNDTDATDNETHIATGNVITGADTTSGAAGADTKGADGAEVTGASSNNVPGHSDNDSSGGFVVDGEFGTLTLNADGSYSYVLHENAPGGSVDTFTYTLTDGDGDTSQATLTITNPDHQPSLDVPTQGEAGTSVDEKGLPPHDGLPAGSGEIADGNANNDSDQSEVTSGTINFTAGDAPATVTIGGVAVTGTIGQTFNGDHGFLTITSYDANAGTIGYTYTLTDSTTDGLNDTDSFAIRVTDVDNDHADGTLTIDIVDDVPTAHADTNSVNEGGSVNGNVLPNDVPGADGFDSGGGVTGVEAGSHPGDVVTTGVGSPIVGAYGTLTLNADGSYTYHATANSNPPADAVDVFTYTITDGDGDTSTTTLTIDVNDVTLTPDNDIVTVNEAALDTTTTGSDLGHGTVTGSNPGSAAETVSGQLVIAGVGATGYTPQSVTTANGIFHLNADGSYTYTLTTPVDGTTADNGTNTVNGVEVFNYTAHDADGNVVNGTITVNVVDDVPTAHADTNSVGEGGSVNGNVLTDGVDDVFGADGQAPGGGVTGVATGSNTAAPVSGNVGSNLAGTYGTLHLNADGTYTYTANPNSVTSAQVDHFVYTITDGDGDTSTVTLDITVNNVTLPADNQTKTVDEAALAIGSNPSSTAETVGGTLNVAGATGYTPAVIVGTHGTLTLNANGTYSYTLTSPVDGTTANNGTNTVNGVEVFNYTAHDAGGNTVNGTITINVIDDVPTAHNDTDSVKEDGPLVADGNVLTGSGGVDANATDGVADTQGADGATVTGIKLPAAGSYGAVATDSAGTQLIGAHGTLTIHADGSYSYQLNNADSAVQALGAGQSTTDTFNYQLTDGDGDLSNANLVITINGTNDAPVVGNSTANVSEEGLTGANPDTTGTPDTTNSATANGTVSFTDVDLSDSHTVTLTAPATALMSGAFNVIWTGSGTNTLHAYADVDGSGNFSAGDTPVMTITIDNAGAYTVTLQGAINHADTTIEDLKSFGVTVNVNDGTTTSTGTLTVNVEDDSPKNFSPQDMNDKTGATVTTFDDALVNDGTAVRTNPINDTNNDHVGENFIGADGFGSLLFTATGHTDGEALKSSGGTALTSHGNAILLSGFGTTVLTAYTESGAHAGYQSGEDHIVFTATLNAGSGNGANSTYTIDFDDTIDDGSGIVLSDFSTAPAGQNQWIGLDSDGNDIAVDNNDSPDLLLTGTNGGTVNTSSSDIGSNNQWIDQNEGIRIDFVTDVNRDGASDEKTSQGYIFDSHYAVNGTSFTIMQEQGSGSGAAVRISAFNDPDSGNIHTLGGSIVPIDITSIVVTGDATYTIVDMGDGTFVITGLAAGANVSFDTGGVDYNAISITNAAGVLNPATPSTTDTFSGQSFAIGEFGYFTAAAGEPIDMSFGVTGTDRDGDKATGTIDVSLVPAGSESSLAANTLMATNSIQSSDSADTNHLFSTNDNHRSFDHRSFEEARGANVGTLAGAIAGAGLVAQPLAAHSLHGHEAFSGGHSAPLMAHGPVATSQLAAKGADHSVAGQSSHGAVATNEMATSHLSAPSDTAMAHSLAGHFSAPQMHATPLLGGTEGHAAAHSAVFTSAAVSIPSAQMLAAHAAANGGKPGGDVHASVAGAQQNAVAQVIADALAGGHGHGPSIDTLLHNATGAHGHAGADALAALASHGAPDVSFLHGGMAAGFAAAHGAPIMHQMMMHQDAAPAHS